MENSGDFIRQFYTDEQLEALAQRPFTEEDQLRVQQAWAAIYADLADLAGRHADPAGAEAQAVAARMQALIDEFTGGDPALEASLQRLYEHRDELPPECRMGPEDEASQTYSEAVMAAYRASRS